MSVDVSKVFYRDTIRETLIRLTDSVSTLFRHWKNFTSDQHPEKMTHAIKSKQLPEKGFCSANYTLTQLYGTFTASIILSAQVCTDYQTPSQKFTH